VRTYYLFALSVAILLLPSCAIPKLIKHGINTDGARSIVSPENSVAHVNLIWEIAPGWQVGKEFWDYCNSPNLPDDGASWCIAQAKQYYRVQEPTTKQSIRNHVQGALRNASDYQCTDFERSLLNLSSFSNLIAGLATTGLAGAGAIVTSGTTSRALAGAAAIVSGGRAEFNADVFYQQAAPILVQAIEKGRAEARKSMDAALTETIEKYPLESAINEALRYNFSCSLVVALGQIQKDVALAGAEPGYTKAFEILEKWQKLPIQQVGGVAPPPVTVK
jgi:hypothetical protein